MLNQTLCHSERIGLVSREIWPVVPPNVEYFPTEQGLSCVDALDGHVNWAMENVDRVENAINSYDTREPH